ncbi:O-antigen ligase family protein [Aquihabitans sp. McL0605]|uniref:O-antigen ligase family protein n=1 Tax=Aquihabitans sp. McL0605 TaxID=3415671 RepID=UPI003CEFAC39
MPPYGELARAGSPPPPNLAVAGMLTRGDPSKHLLVPRWMILLAAIVGQAVLTRAMTSSPIIGAAQAAVILAIIGYSTLKRDTIVALCVLAYIPNAEIVWRQVRAPVPYQLAPYATIAIGVLVMVTKYNKLTKPGRIALFYIMLLIPSTIITISLLGGASRQFISFALAGPFAMATLVALFSQITIEPWLYRRILWVMLVSGLGPLIAALTSISDYIAANGGLVFTDQSNFVTSGGFGPVQVSSLMGLTALCAVLAFLAERELSVKLIAAGLGLFAVVLSFLTFSRGGMTATALALSGLVISQARNREMRLRILTVVAVVFALGYFVIIPHLNQFTNGAFDKRFSDTSSGRTQLATNDLAIFREHPLFGVGPGMTKYNRIPYNICLLRADRCKNEGSSHTEFTRMLGEHGVPGLVAIALIVYLVYLALKRAGPTLPITVAFLTWAIAQMFYANFRVVGIAFAFGFAFVHIAPAITGGAEQPAQPTRPVRAR